MHPCSSVNGFKLKSTDTRADVAKLGVSTPTTQILSSTLKRAITACCRFVIATCAMIDIFYSVLLQNFPCEQVLEFCVL